jgi:hypothetical protein
MLFLWFIGFALAVHQLQKIIKVEANWAFSFAIASVPTYFILLTFPDLFPVMYWVIAMYTYFTPMVVLVWITATLFMFVRSELLETWQLVIFFIATWIFGAFSETTTAVQITWLMTLTCIT